MTTPDPSSRERNGEDPSPDPSSVADDRFVHGLLEFLHHDRGAAHRDRVNAVLERIRSEEGARAARRSVFLGRFVPIATAAILTLVIVSIFVVTPQSTAYATVNEAIRATQTAPQLRYEIRIVEGGPDDGQDQATGTIDMKGELVRVSLHTPRGNEFIMGSDDKGDWSLRRDGSVERFDPRRGAPRWINLGDSTILVGGLDALLEELRNDRYSIERVRSDAQSSAEEGMTQLVALRPRGASKPGPDRVLIWIDDDTSLVERLELRWDHPETADAPGGGERAPAGQRRPPPPVVHGKRPPPRDHPEVLRDHPRFRDNHHPPPPERIVFQRVDASETADSLFSPPDR